MMFCYGSFQQRGILISPLLSQEGKAVPLKGRDLQIWDGVHISSGVGLAVGFLICISKPHS